MSNDYVYVHSTSHSYYLDYHMLVECRFVVVCLLNYLT